MSGRDTTRGLRAVALATVVTLSVFVVTIGGGIAAGNSTGTGWQMPQFDEAKTGYNPDSPAPRANVTMKWECRGCHGGSAPAVANGTVYVGGSGNVTAIDATDGTVRWTASFPGWTRDVAVVNGTGVVINDTGVTAFDPDTASIVWRHDSAGANGRWVTDMTVANGTVFYGVRSQGTTSEHLYALDADTGDERWSFSSVENRTQGIAVANGTVYVTGENATGDDWTTWLHALDVDTGDTEWHYEWTETESNVDYFAREAPVVANGTVYVPAYKRVMQNGGINVGQFGHVYAFDAGGDLRWATNFTGDKHAGTPHIAVADGTIYANTKDRRLYALDADGDVNWNTTTFATGSSGVERGYPAVADGVVYVMDTDGYVRAFDDGIGTELWSRHSGFDGNYPLAVANGTVYSVARNGIVRAWTGDHTGVPNATVSPASVDFGPTLVDETASRVMTVNNTGSADLNLTDVSVTGTDAGEFDATWGGPTTLVPGETTPVTVSFEPTAGGEKSAVLTVSNESGATTVPLSGDGATEEANFTVSLGSTNSPVVAGTTMTVDATIENTGGVDRTWNVTLRTAGTDRDVTPVALAPGEETTAELSWVTSPGDAGAYTATVATNNDSVETAVSVESDEGVTIVDGCGVIDQSGAHVLNDSIQDADASTCIEITASNVAFDGQGHTIDGVDDDSFSHGVYASGTLESVTVSNVTLLGWQNGLTYEDVEGGTVRAVAAVENVNGIVVEDGSSGNVVRDSSTSGGSAGIQISGSNTTVRNSTVSGALFGMLLLQADDNHLEENQVLDNQRGVWLDSASNNTLRNTTFWDNSQRAVSAMSGSSNNTGTGIDLEHTSATLSFTLRDAALSSVASADAPVLPSGTDDVGLYLDVETTESAGYLDLTVAYDETAASIVDESTLSLWRNDGSWSDVGGSLDTGANTLSKNVTDTALVAPLGNTSTATPSFDVSVDSTNAPVTEGETLTVDATVENTGGVESTQTVTLSIDGTEVDSTELTLEASESTAVTFSWATGDGDAGTYTANIASADTSASTPVTVESAPTGGANQVDECTVIDQPGRHVLTQSITNSSAGTCIEITASGVVLDGQGHTVNGVDASSGIGIEVDGAGTVENVTVQDLELVEWETAIPLGTVSNVTVEGTTLRNNHGGIAVGSEAVDNIVRDNTVNGSDIAGIAVSGTNNTIQANEIKNNDDGILVLESGSGGTTLADNVARNNTNSGIRIQTTGIRLENNTVGDNQFGIWFRGGSDTAARNTTFENNSELAVLANPDDDAQSSANNTFTDVDLGYDNATLSFTLRDVALTPEGATDAPAPPTGKADIGVYVNASSTSATGSLDLEVAYDDAAVSTVDESTLSLWNHDGGWTDLGGTLDAGANTLSKSVTSFSVFAPLADSDDGPGQPDFSVEIVDTNSPVNETGTLNVTAAVTNTGNGAGTQTVALSTNETPTVDSRSVALEPGSSGEVTLFWATGADDAGDYVATVDSANDSDSTAVTVRAVDLTPPTVELTAIDANGSAATPPTGQIVHTNGTVSFEVAANGTPGDASSVTVTLEATFANFDHEIEADHQGGTTWTATEDLAALADDGTYAVNVSAVDAAGNENETAGDATARLDREPPELGATVSRLDGGNASVNVTASEVLAEAPTIEVAHNGTTETATIADSGETYWNATFGLAGGGQYNVTAIGTDLAGNEGTGTASARIDTVETENDSATVVLDPSGLFVTFTTDAAVNDTVVVTESNTPLAPLAPGDAGVNFLNAQLGDHIAGNLSYAVIGIPVDMSEVPASVDRDAVGIRYYNETTSSWELQETTIEERTILGTTGEYWVANVSQFSTYGALASDETAPTLDTASPAGELATGTTDATVRFEYQDAISGVDASAVSLSFDTSDVTDDAATSITSQFATYDATGLSTGSHTATVTVEDVAGNSVSYETTFTVPEDDGDDETTSSPGQPPSVHDDPPGRFTRSIVDRNPDEPGVQVSFDDTAVAALTFEDEDLNGSGEVSIEPLAEPSTEVAEEFGSENVVSSVDIEVPAAAEDAPARITFSLSASAVGDRDVDSLQVVRVVAGEPQPLSTEVTEQPDGSVTVVAETPGFSTFVVVSVAGESDSTGAASTVAETATATPGPTPTSEEPSPTMTPASTPTEVPGGMPGFGHLVAVVALLAVGLYARQRW